MSWAAEYIRQLQAGNSVQFRPKGNSMTPRIKSGQLVTVTPLGDALPVVGDVVLCRMPGGTEYLHNVTAAHGDRFLIANNKGHANGWTTLDRVFGRLTRVDP